MPCSPTVLQCMRLPALIIFFSFFFLSYKRQINAAFIALFDFPLLFIYFPFLILVLFYNSNANLTAIRNTYSISSRLNPSGAFLTHEECGLVLQYIYYWLGLENKFIDLGCNSLSVVCFLADLRVYLRVPG